MNLSISLGHAIPVDMIGIDTELLVNVNVSLKIVAATVPQGIATAFGSRIEPFMERSWPFMFLGIKGMFLL